ncbi:hypothetical protein D7X30_18640 [Corallococcus sp. AB011P]|uniref:hypothetical protein n=1 Tax=Corallococcus sp. AB011P TaxID=2316735 RepID=UPI000EA05D6B|nr:hypothetical protein [Corallococcus sp. AB011P]RKG57527.1 hypothetical protein D7X30_18640 [Corallococcus sp. AB011P]
MSQRRALVLAGRLLLLVAILVLAGKISMTRPLPRPEVYVPVRDAARELPVHREDWSGRHCLGIMGSDQWQRYGSLPSAPPDAMSQEEAIHPKSLADCDLYVVRVTEVHAWSATFSRPPRVPLTVDQVILGELQPRPFPAVFSEPLGDHLCGNAAMEEAEQRAREPIPGPMLGERFILARGWCRGRDWFEVSSRNRWPVTDTMRADLTATLKQAREENADFDTRIEARRKEDLAAQTDAFGLCDVKQGDLARVQALLEGGARERGRVRNG